MDEFYQATNEERIKRPKRIKAISYKLGEEIAYGVRYFGVGAIKGDRKMIKAICPTCEEMWEVSLYNVQSGNSTSCCGHKLGKKGKL
jgi:hypothetical protein